MRANLYEWLSTDSAISAIVGDRVFPINLLDSKPTPPYLVYRFNPATPRIVPAMSQNFQIWAHDKPGDYSQIDTLLELVKVNLTSQEAFGNFYEVAWIEDSEDLFDEASETITRLSRFVMVLKVNYG